MASGNWWNFHPPCIQLQNGDNSRTNFSGQLWGPKRQRMCTAEGVTGHRTTRGEVGGYLVSMSSQSSSFFINCPLFPGQLVELLLTRMCLFSHHSSERWHSFPPGPPPRQSEVPTTQISYYALPISPVTQLICCSWALSLYRSCWFPFVDCDFVLFPAQREWNPKSINHCVSCLFLYNKLPPNLAACIGLLGSP